MRHRGKIASVVNNARRACELVEEHGSLAAYLWGFEPDPAARPAHLTRAVLMDMATTPESTALSKDLKRRGWRFVGPTTVYAFMQSVGLVNDHEVGCDTRDVVQAARSALDLGS